MASHAEEHRPADRETRERRALRGALIANAALLVVEAAAGSPSARSRCWPTPAICSPTCPRSPWPSPRCVSPGGRRPPDNTFGFERAEVLAAQLNALLLVGVMVWIVLEAVHRLDDPGRVEATGLLVVASIALLVNAVSSLVLARAARRSLNMQGAYLHLATDAAGSLAAIVAALLILGWQLEGADPISSLATAGFVAWAAFRLLRSTTHVLMEGAPRELDAREVERMLLDAGDVVDVHHLHLWSLASDVPALSAHVVLAGEPTVADAQRRGEALKATLAERFGIAHVTLELECDADHSAAERAER